MTHLSFAAAMALVAANCSADSTSLNQNPSAEDWREDLRVLARELPKRHANAFHAVARDSFERAVANLDSRLDSLSADESAMGLAAIVASIGDGHTRVRLPSNWSRYSVATQWFGCLEGSTGPCELRVVNAAPGFEHTLGAVVVDIDGVPTSETWHRILTIVPRHESEGADYFFGTQYLQIANVLHGLGIARSNVDASFRLRDSSGTESVVRIATVSRATPTAGWRRAASASALPGQRGDEPLWWTMLADSQTAYLSFTSYPDKGAFRRTTRELIDLMNTRNAGRLIIDMRRNGGGDFTKVRESLLPALRKHPALATRGRLYVLTGPNTFSAAMVNAVDFRKEANAILVGLPTGARPNGYQEGREFSLPRSRLSVGYSTKYYKFQDEDTPGVLPDHRVHTAWDDFRAGRDTALEWILAQPL